MRITLHISMFHVFIVCLEYLSQGITDGMSLNREKVDASVILEAFCNLEHKLNVMECVDDATDGQALMPWKYCLNIDRILSKKELISLSCKSLYPGYKEVLDILTACVDGMMSPDEVVAWMPVLEFCADRVQSTRMYMEDSYETSSTNHKFYPTT